MPAPKKTAPTKSSNARSTLFPVVASGLVLLVLFGYIFTRATSPQKSGSIASTSAPANEQQIFSTYGGSASCKECHEEAYAAWAKSNHGLAERLPVAGLDDAAFLPATTFRHGTQQTSLRKSGDNYEVITAGLTVTQEVFRVDRVIGQMPLRQMLVPFAGGRWQVTEAAFDPRSNDWFNVYGEEDRKPGEWGQWAGRGMNWNSMCATCHNTRLQKNYDPTNDVYHTTMVERGVGCESCHGPMKAHNDWQHAHKNSSAPDPTITKISRDQMLDTCAACHSRRSEITGDPKPGDSYFDHHLISIVDDSDLFYPDGQIHDEDYEVTAFLGSKMYQHGVRCMDCHDFHSAKVRLPGNLLCLTCHSAGQTNAPVINPVSHAHHKVFGCDPNGVMSSFDLSTYKPGAIKETGGECVNCHMPQTIYMQRHSRHDHGFTIPDPLLTKQFGIPNACNRCHQDKNTDWSLKYVQDWYGEKMNRPTRQRAQSIARAKNGEDAARDELLDILKTDPQKYWQAVAARMLERWVGDAPVSAGLLEKLSDTNALVRQNVVQTLAALGNSASPEIRGALDKCLNDPSRNVRVVAAQARAATLDLHSAAALDLFGMLNHNADQPAGQMQLGLFSLARGDGTNALRHFQTAARWDSYSPGIRQELAVVLSQLGRPHDAVNELLDIVRLVPQNAELHFQLALAWNDLGETAKVLPELEEAVKLDPQNARAGYNLGLARNAAGNPTGAIQALLTAESANPRDPNIPYARATIHARLGQKNAALQAARRALELNPQFTQAAVLLQQLQQ